MNSVRRRLLRQVPALRRLLAYSVLAAAARGALVVAQASVLADVLARGFLRHAGANSLAGSLVLLVALVGIRAGLGWLHDAVAQRTAATVKQQLRHDLLDHSQRLGPGWLSGQRSGELTTVTGTGLDALDDYVTGYLPQLVIATVVPVAVIARLAIADWPSAVVIVVTLPLIPIFGALVGWHTRTRTARQWGLLTRLGGHFLDAVRGLPTLRAFGRAETQVEVIRRMAEAHRRATMRTLRVAFLSSLVLELVATLSVALVAVPVGLRLLAGHLDLTTALLVLLLAPEAYLPLRAVGTQFHASMRGLAAAEQIFAVLDEHPARTTRPRTGISERATIGVARVSVRYPGRGQAALHDVSLRLRPGERVALIGPSGSGKSTLLALLLGFVTPESGRVWVGDTDLPGVDLQQWRRRIAWVPQQPHLFAGTVADNIALGAPEATLADVRRAARAAAVDDVVTALPAGYATPLGERGVGLSAGQRQRVALARAFLRDAPIVLLDEPTASLDSMSEATVLDATQRLMAGRTVLVVAHRPALLAHVDRVVELSDGRVVGDRAAVPHLAQAVAP